MAISGWFLIAGYSGWRFLSSTASQIREGRKADNDKREKFFGILNDTQDIKDRLKLLDRDIGRNINRLHDMGKEAGYYDRTDRPGTERTP